MRVQVPPPVPFPGGLQAAQQDSESCPRWFEPSPGSFAVTRGRDPASVRQAVRVGTGQRLHVLVVERQTHSVEVAVIRKGRPGQIRASAPTPPRAAAARPL